MSALTAARATTYNGVPGRQLSLTVEASATVYNGSMVGIDAYGHATAATASSGSVAGIANMNLATLKNGAVTSPSDGYAQLNVDAQVSANLDNDGTHPVTQAWVGKECFVVDDHTVAGSGGSGTKAGIVAALNDDGSVAVLCGLGVGVL